MYILWSINSSQETH